MELIKKIFIAIIALALVAGVVYIISVSYRAQESREKSEMPQQETVVPPDSGEEQLTPPDTSRIIPVPPMITKPETLSWHSLPDSEKIALDRQFPTGNPNPVFITAARRILPAVVTVKSELLASSIPKDEDHQYYWDRHGDEDFFQEGTGSGIIISPDGYVLTNYHVVENGSDYTLILYDKREYKGVFIGGDPNTDVALLKVDARNLPTAYIGNSDSVEIGEWVMAVGSPLNFTSTITAGIISALGRNIRIINSEYSVENFIQTDAVINPGNSGGALINVNGEVIGVNTAIATRTGLYQGYGFAIPINLAYKIINDILAYGEVRRGLLGVSISTVDDRVAKGVGLSHPTGVLVQGVQPGKAADDAGIEAGDVILSVNGQEVVSVNDLQIKIASKPPGEMVTLKIWRNKQPFTFKVKLGKAPVARVENKNNTRKSFENLGMKIRDLTSMEKKSLELDHGIYVEEVKTGSPASKGGIFSKFILYRMENYEIDDADDFEKKLDQLKSGDVIKIIGRPIGYRSALDDRIFFVEIE
jgi:serine protease Do